jgi:hypothetical protein
MRLLVSRPSRLSQTYVVEKLGRQILMHAADPEIVRMHAGARGALVKYHQLLTLRETPERRGQRADVHGLGRDVEEMRQKPTDFAKEDADKLPALWHRYFEQFFGGEAEGMLLIHRCDVVEPVEIGQGLQIVLVLYELFRAAME